MQSRYRHVVSGINNLLPCWSRKRLRNIEKGNNANYLPRLNRSVWVNPGNYIYNGVCQNVNRQVLPKATTTGYPHKHLCAASTSFERPVDFEGRGGRARDNMWTLCSEKGFDNTSKIILIRSGFLTHSAQITTYLCIFLPSLDRRCDPTVAENMENQASNGTTSLPPSSSAGLTASLSLGAVAALVVLGCVVVVILIIFLVYRCVHKRSGPMWISQV